MDMSKLNKHSELADRVREAMAASGVSRAEIARLTGLSYSVVHGAAAGTRDITAKTVTLILGAIGLEVRIVRKRKGAK